MSSGNSGFSVLEMAREMADANNIDPHELFKKEPDNPKPQGVKEPEKISSPETVDEQESTADEWSPDSALLEGMEEFNSSPVIYAKSEIRTEENQGFLKNIADESAIQQSRETMDELTRKQLNIEEAKQRHGISKFRIPEGKFHVLIYNAAIDTNHERGQKKLDEIFDEIKKTYPEFILEYSDPSKTNTAQPENSGGNIVELPQHNKSIAEARTNNGTIVRTSTGVSRRSDPPAETIPDTEVIEVSDDTDIKVVIDKTNLPEVSWTCL